ncbi:hypothetical protein GOP47_0023163 [Adiantum capillus-veneris]|uniref:F-box domain-containing protein n=1 Tax=Adiantum capillus-veneris TaxID=13818 RepID=A0A9D4U8R3_ADICA|nr:hypothetical protein GOP47_0023163 [Adiantum capillus-veneris]
MLLQTLPMSGTQSRRMDLELHTVGRQETDDAIIPGLPNEVSMLCLARLPLGLHPLASCVCRSWRYALKLPLLYDLRTRLGLREHHVFIWAPAKLGLLSRKCTQFYLIDPLLLKCHPLPPPPLLRGYPHGFHCDVVALGRQVAITRICSGHRWESPQEVFCFDVVSRLWCEPPPPMLESRTWFASASVDGFVYAAGGGSGCKFVNLKSVERFNLVSKKWERIGDMKKERYMAAGIALKGSFCVLGGCQSTQEGTYIMHDSAEIWDPLKEEWELIPDMWPNDMWKVAVVKGKVYGLRYWHTKEVMWFDEKSNKWQWLGGLTENLQGEIEYDLIGVGDELWVLVKDAHRKCSLFATNPERLPLCWRVLPISFDNYPSNICVVTL